MTHGPPARRKISQNETTDLETQDDMPKPPDGGWGWVVVWGSFMIHIISKYMYECNCVLTVIRVMCCAVVRCASGALLSLSGVIKVQGI